jgi:hypothetical protein
LAGWRFGVLGFILSAMIVLLIELVGAVAHATSEIAEVIAARYSQRRSKAAETRATLDNTSNPGASE